MAGRSAWGSQGAAKAWRAAARRGPCHGLVVLADHLPGDVARVDSLALPPGRPGPGDQDPLCTGPQLERDLANVHIY